MKRTTSSLPFQVRNFNELLVLSLALSSLSFSLSLKHKIKKPVLEFLTNSPDKNF